MTHKHANYQDRLGFVQRLLHEQFKLEANAKMDPIQYDPECPFRYNNFVYHIRLPSPITPGCATKDEARQPGYNPIPNGAQEFIVRLTNPDAEGTSPETRVENEVAMINLAAAALRYFHPLVVPSGWIIQELMPGESQKKLILSQMAKLLKILQDYRLSESIIGFGGVMFDENGRIVSAAMTSVGAGPWLSYESSFKGRLEVALQRADANRYIQGWHVNGVRDSLVAFVQHGVRSQFESLETARDKAIIHADFTTNNLLFDASTGRITALIDYDFACIMHPSYEFLRSFDNAAGEQAALREAKLHGFPSPLPQSTKDEVNWEIAKAWEDELEKLDVNRPVTIEGTDKKVIMKCREENEKLL
ncbi:hypothetical protein F5Y19DRAFT_468535 [Xylariaceae sp. FL1651]|nr:hypothetical protein F5Y19DRAFT_468535 [Xylariaceae sp. FL1651]